MKKAVNSLVIDFFLNSSEFDFHEFNMDETMTELEPLLINTIKNYLYLKRTNLENVKCKNVNFIQASK